MQNPHFLKSGRTPDFIGLGARRCGSSWLHQALNEHPDIGKPQRGLHYFSDQYDKGRQWYLEQLEPYVEKKILLEMSVSYFYPEFSETLAKRIYRDCPEVSLFVTLRDPVERFFSDFLRSKRMLEIPSNASIREVAESHGAIINRGKYKDLLMPFLDVFGLERLKIFYYEDLERSPESFFADVCSYMGISEVDEVPGNKSVSSRSMSVRSALAGRFFAASRNLSDHIAETIGKEEEWRHVKRRYQKTYQRLLSFNYVREEMERSDKVALQKVYEDDVKFLRALEGREVFARFGTR